MFIRFNWEAFREAWEIRKWEQRNSTGCSGIIVVAKTVLSGEKPSLTWYDRRSLAWINPYLKLKRRK